MATIHFKRASTVPIHTRMLLQSHDPYNRSNLHSLHPISRISSHIILLSLFFSFNSVTILSSLSILLILFLSFIFIHWFLSSYKNNTQCQNYPTLLCTFARAPMKKNQNLTNLDTFSMTSLGLILPSDLIRNLSLKLKTISRLYSSSSLTSFLSFFLSFLLSNAKILQYTEHLPVVFENFFYNCTYNTYIQACVHTHTIIHSFNVIPNVSMYSFLQVLWHN